MTATHVRSDPRPTTRPERPLLRRPTTDDGPSLWRIADAAETLDTNSPYSYLLWCRDFADSSVVAIDGDEPRGFITGYVRPDDEDTFFIWQIAVEPAWRGRGLARQMVDHLCDRMTDLGRTHLEASVTPDNTPSTRLFESVARDRDATIERSVLFGADAFPDGHASEVLLRIGPL